MSGMVEPAHFEGCYEVIGRIEKALANFAHVATTD